MDLSESDVVAEIPLAQEAWLYGLQSMIRHFYRVYGLGSLGLRVVGTAQEFKFGLATDHGHGRGLHGDF